MGYDRRAGREGDENKGQDSHFIGVKTTLAQNLAGKYSAFDALRVQRAARRLRAAWRMTGGPGVTITKSEAKFHIEAASRECSAPLFRFFRAYMPDVYEENHFSLGTFAAGTYDAWYLGGYFQFLTMPLGWATAIGGNGIVTNGDTAYKPVNAGLTYAQAIADTWPVAFDSAAHSGGSIYAHFEDDVYAYGDNKWPRYGNEIPPGDPATGTSWYAHTPIYGVNVDGNEGAFGQLWITDSDYTATIGDVYWRSYPFTISYPFYLWGELGCEYETTYRITLYAPCPSSALDNVADTLFLGLDYIKPAYAGVGFAMTTVTADITEQWTGGGYDEAGKIHSAVELLHYPTMPHRGTYCKIEHISTTCLG